MSRKSKLAVHGEPRARVAHAHPETNGGKLAQVDATLYAYCDYMQICVDTMFAKRRTTVSTGLAEDMHGTFPPCTTMTSQLQKCARIQAVGMVKTWHENIYRNRLSGYITANKSKYTKDQVIQLRTIGKYGLTEPKKLKKGEITQTMIDLYWSWVWDESISGKRPTTSKCGMMLSEMCIKFGPADEACALGGWWVRMATLTPNAWVPVPLSIHPSLVDGAKLANGVLVKRRFDGHLTFQFVEYNGVSPVEKPGMRHVGLDIGLNALATTSDGRIYGAWFKPIFDARWAEIREARSNRRRQGFTTDSPRIARMERALTGYITTVVNTIAKQIVRDHPNTIFELEDGNLKGAKGSKRFHYKAMHRALRRYAVCRSNNPAYTSQECPSCHNVMPENRHGTKFCCKVCGRISHADCVGALNLLGRSEDEQITRETSVVGVSAILETRDLAARGARPSAPAAPMMARRTLSIAATTRRDGTPNSGESLSITRHSMAIGPP